MDLNDGCHLGGSWVGYDDYGQCHFHNIGSDYTIEWSFRSRNSVVNVTAIAIDITNFTIFESSRSFEGFVLSNGTKSQDSGIFRPPNVDIWYIVFWHNDSDTQLVTMLERRTEKIYEPEGIPPLNKIEFTETIILTKTFRTRLEWSNYYNDYRNLEREAEAIFYLAGDNVSMTVKVEHIRYIDYTKVIAENKYNQTVIEHQTTPDHNITILNYKDWTFKFHFKYKCEYLGCINYGNTYCYEEDWKTAEGIRTSEEYDFEEKNPQTVTISGFIILTFGLVAITTILVIKRKTKVKKL